MTTIAVKPSHRKGPLLNHAVLGTAIFVATEVMFFVALVSAFLVIKSTKGAWVPPANIRLPVLATSFNTGILILSGVFLFLSGKHFADKVKTSSYLIRALALGGFFVFFQGYEWIQLINYGMTMRSGLFGATFFLLIGAHGLHALCGVFVLLWAYLKHQKGLLTKDQLSAIQIFWFFVVGIWPALFGLVYF